MIRILHYFIIILVLSGNVLYQQVVQTLTHDTGQGAHPSIVQVSTNVFAVAYHGTSGKGIIKTFTIASNGSTITENQELQHDGSKAKYNSLIQVDSDTYLLAYEGGSNDGFIKTFIHGFLHLLNYDHKSDKDYAIMNSIENKIFRKIKG